MLVCDLIERLETLPSSATVLIGPSAGSVGGFVDVQIDPEDGQQVWLLGVGDGIQCLPTQGVVPRE